MWNIQSQAFTMCSSKHEKFKEKKFFFPTLGFLQIPYLYTLQNYKNFKDNNLKYFGEIENDLSLFMAEYFENY